MEGSSGYSKFLAGDAGRATVDQIHAEALDKLRERGLDGYILFYTDKEGQVCVMGHTPNGGNPSILMQWAVAINRHAMHIQDVAGGIAAGRLFRLLFGTPPDDNEDEGEDDGIHSD